MPPYDPAYDEEEKRDQAEDAGRDRRFNDFDCPECAANNPYDDGFGHGDEVRCYYCGQEFRAEVNESGKLRLKVV
jgi:transcription elongation factor Elf1